MKIDTVDQTNQRIAELAQAAEPKRSDYRVGVDDVLTVEVFEVPELSRDVRVNEDGFISLPLLPMPIQAAGLSIYQLQGELADLLRSNGLVSNPQVTVRLKEVHSAPITVMGAVRNPGVVQASRSMTLLEVISQAGGVAPDAGADIIVTRPPAQDSDPAGKAAAAGSTDATGNQNVSAQPQTFTIALNELLDVGGSQFNIPVHANDVVRVPRAGVVYALGAVNRPGGYVMQNDGQQLTVLKILALAGGIGSTGKTHESVILRKDQITGKQRQVPVNVYKILKLKSDDVALEQSDILYIPDSAGLRALRRTGEVAISIGTGVALYKAITP